MDESRVRNKKSKLKKDGTNLETGKAKKKIKSALAKVVETTELLSHFSKSSKLSSSSKKTQTADKEIKVSKHKSSNKFKTGGIVATAVQPIKKTKKTKLPSTITHPVPNIIKLIDSTEDSDDGENMKKFVKKVKSKIKKKKSK